MHTETTSTGQRPSVLHGHPRVCARAVAAGSSCPTLLLLAVAVLWCAYWFARARGYWEDDAWIHLEFARSVAEGHGFSFNGITVSADTAPLWVLLLAGAHALVPDWMAAGKLLSALGALAGFSGIFAFTRHIAGDLLPHHSRNIFAAGIVLLTAVNPYTCYWIFSGMEAVAAAGLACWALLACTAERPTIVTFLTGCALAGLAPLLRPEMLMLTALLAASSLWQLRRSGTKPSLRPLLLAAAVLLLTLPLAGWSLYSLHAFGHLLPSTVAAKRDAPGHSVLLRVAKVYLCGLPLLVAGMALAPLCLRRCRRLPLAAWLLMAWTAISTVFYIANHTYVQTRYVLVSAPALTAVILAILAAAWPRTARAMYAGALLWSAALSLLVVRPFLRNKAIDCRASAEMASFIREHIPAAAPVAVYSIGEIAFLSRHPIVDTGGVTRPAALPYLNLPPDAVLEWAESEGAQYAIAAGDRPPQPGSVPILTVPLAFAGWEMNVARYAESSPVSLWKLPPHTLSAAQTQTAKAQKSVSADGNRRSGG